MQIRRFNTFKEENLTYIVKTYSLNIKKYGISIQILVSNEWMINQYDLKIISSMWWKFTLFSYPLSLLQLVQVSSLESATAFKVTWSCPVNNNLKSLNIIIINCLLTNEIKKTRCDYKCGQWYIKIMNCKVSDRATVL